MPIQRVERFDYEAERAYYAQAPSQLRGYMWLEAYYQALSADYSFFFYNRRVLDMGAGECLHGIFVCSQCHPTAYVNLDLFADRMQLAASKNRFSAMSFVSGDCFRLPFAKASFDTVWASGVLVRLRPLDEVAPEIKRVLSPGGIFLGIEPNFQSVFVMLKRARTGNKNDWKIQPRDIYEAFSGVGMAVEFKFFWRRIPWLKHPLLSPTLGIIARRSPIVNE